MLVPVNTRFKGPEAADILRRSRARALVTVTDFLGTDYVAMLRRRRRRPSRPGHRRGRPRPGPARAPRRGSAFLARATGRRTGRGRPARVGPRRRRPVATSCSPRGRPACPKGWSRPTVGTLRVATDWVAMTGLTADDRYLMVNPYFHMFGLKAGILAAVGAGAAMLPEAVFDVDRVLARWPSRRSPCSPAPHPLPVHPRPSRPRPPRPVQPPGGGDRRRRHPGRAHPAGRTTSSPSPPSSPATG